MMKFAATAALLLGVASAIPTPDIDANSTDGTLARRATSFWYANMDHTGTYRGYAPDLDNDYSYPVYMAVSAGDGAGIQTAINAADNGATRHGQWLASQPRVRPSP